MCPETRLWPQESLERFNTKTSSEFEARLIAEAGCLPAETFCWFSPRADRDWRLGLSAPLAPARPGPRRPGVPEPGSRARERASRPDRGPCPRTTERPPSHRKDSSPRLRAASGGAGATHRHFCPPQVRAEGCEGRARNRPRQSRWKTTLPRSLGLGPQHTTAIGGGGGYGTPGISPPWVGGSGAQKEKRDLKALWKRPRTLVSCSWLGERGPKRASGERRGGGDAGAPRLLGYPLGFPLTFIRDRQELERRPPAAADPPASRALGARRRPNYYY